ERVSRGREKAVHRKRLLYEVEGSELEGANGHIDRPVARDYEHLHLGPALFHLREGVEAAHPGQPYIEHGEVGTMGGHLLQADDCVLGDDDRVALVLEYVPDRGPNAGLIVDHEDGCHLAL